MELDVHLTRDGDQPWGFEFVGGADCHMLLTIDKVYPSSPAFAAGLQAGDVVARLGDRLATELSQEDALAIVAESVASLSFGICRGLYDPVLDDFELIYEPTDRADSDLRSEPTEVYPQDLSLDDPNILDPSLTDPSLWDSGYATRPVTDTRSLTASPFVPNSKPYRPFSTEPLDVPSLDDPIILNPNYNDTFNSNSNAKVLGPEEDDLLQFLPLDKNIEAKFKLPVSERYDPDWDKKVRAMLEKCADGGKHENQQIENELVYYSDKSEVSVDIPVTEVVVNKKATKEVTVQDSVTYGNEIGKQETKFNQIKEELSVQKIEQVALEVVEESIERAVSVTEDIQKEIEEERASMARELQEEGNTNSLEKICTEKNEIKKETKESVSKTDLLQYESETLDDLKQESERIVFEGKEIQEKLKLDEKFVEEKRLSTKMEMEESIETGNVRRKSSVFEKQNVDLSNVQEEKKLVTETSRSAETVKKQSTTFKNDDEPARKEESRNASTAEELKTKHASEFRSSAIFSNETSKSEGKQKAYMIGLQTIPHIKGFVQSSYHFDLLLRTFFVHLTDVMVALSRFILTQPTQELESKAEKVVKEKLIREFVEQDNIKEKNMTEQKHEEKKQSVQSFKEEKLLEKNIKDEKNVVQAKQDIKNIKQMSSQEIVSKKEESLNLVTEDLEIKKKSGSEMAQRTQRKSRDLTQKMDAVITEFETKTGIDDRLEITEQKRRSRSRSHIEDEVMRESDPLEWLDKVDSRRASEERSNVTVEKEFSSYSESKESKRSESKHESRTTTVKPAKQMYVAIVESHVYTNKDAILEDQATEMSETASVQSSEEINAALESFEAMSTEKVAMSNVIQSEEKQQAVEVITNALQEVVQEKQEILEALSDFKSKNTEQQSKTVMQESFASIAAESTEIVSETKVEAFKTSDFKETKVLALQEENYKTAAVEFVNEPLEATKEVIVEINSNQHGTVSKQELLTTVAAETTETIDETKLESLKPKEIISKQVVVSSEENYKTTAESISEMILEASKEETTEFKVKEHQAVSKVESLAIAVAESTEVVDDSKVETFESQELVSKKALVKSEETFKTTAVGVTEVTFETAEDKHSETAKTNEVTIKEEAQHLAVAGIIETKTELCKELKKPAEDEYASLKIVKEQVIDGDESVEMSQSEINVKQSLEVDIASSLQSNYQSMSLESSTTHKMTSSIQETSSSIQQSRKSAKSLTINTSLAQNVDQTSDQSDQDINTPTPSTVPPTPLTDEYVFKLEIPLPKNQGTVVVEESPDREDPHIVKKGLVPHIETTIEDQIIYDPPLPTPPEDKVQAPVYTKPGLKGGAAPLFKKEYIREIERKSSLLASAIDQTIKSIEEYKEEVGIDSSHVTVQLSQTKLEPIANGLTNGHGENGVENKCSYEEKGSTDSQATKDNAATNGTDSAIESSLPGFKPVVFNPEAYQSRLYEEVVRGSEPAPVEVKPYVDAAGEPLGTVQGIVDGLEDATVDEEVANAAGEPLGTVQGIVDGLEDATVDEEVANAAGEPLGTVQGIVDGLEDATVDEEVAKELGKPGLTEDKIAELISGESEMMREAHVMGLSRVLNSHMTRPEDSSVDFQKIKPLYESLKDSEVLKALNEEIKRESEKKKSEEKKWTTFLQKPKGPMPRAKFGYPGYVEEFDENQEPYKVKIVKQPKPKIAPDYKPEDFDTGPLPWEQRALIEPVPSPVPPEEPILVPEEAEYFEAVDPLPETEVPDLEDTGIPLPPTPPPAVPDDLPEPLAPPDFPDLPDLSDLPAPEPEEQAPAPDMDQNAMAEQLVNTIKSMVDPNAPLELQLCQMRAQLAALAQLPCVIQQSLELLTCQLSAMSRQETHQNSCDMQMDVKSQEIVENTVAATQEYQEQVTQNEQEASQNYQEVVLNGHGGAQKEENTVAIEEVLEEMMTAEEAVVLKREHDAMVEEQRKSEKEIKERQEKVRLDQESRQLKQRAPRVGKPCPVFGPLSPEERPQVLPGGRRWRCPQDAYDEQSIAETIQAQSEVIQGKVMGINFMKYEKPPVSLDHLQHSATYKLIHNIEEAPLKRTDLLTPVIGEADYRERCRSATPYMQANGRM